MVDRIVEIYVNQGNGKALFLHDTAKTDVLVPPAGRGRTTISASHIV